MKKIVLTLALVSVAFLSCKEGKKEKLAVNDKMEEEVEVVVVENNVDTESSVLYWEGSKPTGTHNGTVKIKKGSLVVEDGEVQSGEFLIDMSSIVCLDLKDSDYGKKLEGHLKSSDFFDVAKYPVSKFVITSVEDEDGELAITGNLTIKDVTKSITIPASLEEDDNGVITLTSDEFSIDRSEFNVKYGSKKFFDNLKDKFISDLMEMSFVIKTKE